MSEAITEATPRPIARSRKLGYWIALGVVWILSLLYVSRFVSRGWIPHDEGILGQSAERVLNGEVPHLDFPEIYTGGLTYWHAFAFRVFGLRLISLRLILFLSFLAFVPVVFAVASRFGSPLASALVTLLAVVWSLPNYFTAIPSWYNLFLATWATFALVRHVETGQRRWLFLAGVIAGVSCLFKVIGAHFIAASLLFLLYREQDLSAQPGRVSGERRVSGYLLFKTGGLTLFLTLLFLTVRRQLNDGEFLHFVVPSAALCAFLIWCECFYGSGRFADRFSRLMRLTLPLVAGVLLPVLLFLVPYAVNGALGDLTRGLIIGTAAHVQFVHMRMPTIPAFWPAVPYTIVLGAGPLRRFRFAGPAAALLAGVLAALLWLSGSSPDAYGVIWNSMRPLGVAVVLAACLRLADAQRLGVWSPETRQKIFLLAAVVGVSGLVQFPFAAPIYFLYIAPLVALAIFALVGSEPLGPRFLHGLVLAFYFLFALLRANPGYVYPLGYRFERYDPRAVLDVPRAAGLRVTAEDAELYGSLIPLVQEKAGGRLIYAGPDCPEVHFLSGLEDAAPRGPDAPRDPMARPEQLLRTLEEKGTRAVVLNRLPGSGPKIRPEVFALFEKHFPQSREIGRFVVLWRD